MNSRQVLIGLLAGFVGVALVGLLVVAAYLIGFDLGMQKAKETKLPEAAEEGETKNAPKKDAWEAEEFITVVMRVSGEQGTRYTCTYSDTSDEGEPLREEQRGVLQTRPVEYRARILVPEDRPPLNFYGGCSLNPEPEEPPGRLKIELLVNGQVVDSGESSSDQKSAKSSRVEVSYAPLEGGPDPNKKK